MRNKTKLTGNHPVFNIIAYTFISIVAFVCLLPFLLVISGSITEESAIFRYGFTLIPREISFHAYEIIFRAPEAILRAYGVTIFITVTGTVVGLFITAMTAYVLYRKDFKYRNVFSFFFYFTTLFSGGLVSYYIFMVRHLQIQDTYFALILPLLLNVFFLLIMRSFMNSIPFSIVESAKIDGAGDFTIFTRIVLWIITPALAAIGLFIALAYWNDWFNAMLFIDDHRMYPLQYMLYRIINNVRFASAMTARAGVPAPRMPQQSIQLAMTVVATGPIIFLYPFLQKYFVKGITIGAVKG